MKTRMYFLVNQYMMGIQAGIQAGHAACEMLANYWDEDRDNPKVKLIEQWLKNDKTFIVLDGGYQKRMYEFADKALLPNSGDIPYAYFHEEDDSLNGALTAIAFILPEHVWSAKLEDDGSAPEYYFGDNFNPIDYTYGEKILIPMLKMFPLKRG